MNSLKKVISTMGNYAHNFRYAVLLLLPLFLLTNQLSAQQPAVEMHWSPENPDPGDEATISFTMGTTENSASDITEIDTTFSYSDSTFSLSGGSSDTISIDENESWFADDNNWTGYIILNADAESIRIFLKRTNNQPRSGAGLIATGGEVVIVIEEIMVRRRQTLKNPLFTVHPNPSANHFQINAKGTTQIRQIHVLTTMGQTVKSQKIDQLTAKIDMTGLPSQTYLVQIIDADGYQETKRWIKL